MKKIFVFVLLIILSTQIAFAQRPEGVSRYIPCMVANDPADPSQKEPSGLNCNSWQDLINVIQFFINSAFIIATFLATVSFTYAGWLYLTSQGDPDKINQAHGIFLKVLQGFIFMAIAYLLVKTILSTIVQSGYSLLQ